MFQTRSGTTKSLVFAAYCCVSFVNTYACPYPLVYLLPRIPSTDFTPMGSSIHLDAAGLPHLVSEFSAAYSVFSPSINCPRPPSSCAYSPLNYMGLVPVSLPSPLSFAPWGVSRHLCLSRASREASSTMALSNSSVASFRHHGFLQCPPPLNSGPRAQTSNIGLKSTQHAVFPFQRQMYLSAVCIPDALNISPAASVYYIPSMFLRALSPMIFLKNIIWVPSTILVVTSNLAHNYNPNNRTACITAQ